MTAPTDYEELGQMLADTIDKLYSQRTFAGDLEGTFIVPLEDGSEYLVVVSRQETTP